MSTGGGPLMPWVAVCVSHHPNCLGGCTGAGLGVADNCCCDTTLWSRQVGEAFDGCALTDVGLWVPVGLWVCALTDHLHFRYCVLPCGCVPLLHHNSGAASYQCPCCDAGDWGVV